MNKRHGPCPDTHVLVQKRAHASAYQQLFPEEQLFLIVITELL